MRRAAGLALTLACVAAHVLALPRDAADPQAGAGLQLSPQARSHIEKDPERFDFFGELREEQCQDDLDCDRNTGRVCARKPSDAAGHCRCPPEKPNKDAQGQCQPSAEQQPGCQQNADCGKPLLECVERQCRCVPPNVLQADASCAPPQGDARAEPSASKSTWLSPLAFLFSILLLMTCTVFVTRYRKDEDALDEMSETGAGGAGGTGVASWSAAKAATASSSSAARLQPRMSPAGSDPGQRGPLEPRSAESEPGSEQEASSVGQVDEDEASDRLTVSSTPDSEGIKMQSRQESAQQQSSGPTKGPEVAMSVEVRKADAAPISRESSDMQQQRPSSMPRPIKQLSRCSSDGIQLPEFVRSPTQQGGDVGWPDMVPVQRIRRGLQLLGSTPRRDQLQHLLDGRDLFEREDEGVEVDQQQLLQPPREDAVLCKTVQTDITLAAAIVPFAALDSALWPMSPSRCDTWPLPPSRCDTVASKVPPLLTVDCGDYKAGRSSGLEPGSSELFLAERHEKPLATTDAPLVHQSPNKGIGGGAGAASAQDAKGLSFPSPVTLRVRASGEGPSTSSQQPQSERSRCEGRDSSMGISSSPGTAKNKSRYSIRQASSGELDRYGSEAAASTDNNMASVAANSAIGHVVMQAIEEASASADPTSEPPSELMGTVPRPYHESSVGEGSSQDCWAHRLRPNAADEDTSVSFQSFDVEAQVSAAERQ
ncbi:microtubule-associated protein futsch-like [Dermacentor albipictus]|uniref:microtubule-associated protein futsch-like n=1 Tax=Dermacentor albipictus TaxID=60249 RepID=UPI0031FC3C2B